MSGLLLDTNVLSEFNRRDQPDYYVKQWLTAADTNSLHASVITFAEIRLGIELLASGKRRSQLEQWLDHDLRGWFAGGRLLPVNEPIANQWASFTAHRQRLGKPLANFDGLLAATAHYYSLTLVTRNVKDFAELGITLLNPWKP
jgi:predicted nucleic acid-binding protein